ncbi:phosphatidylglycerol lysyltransferase domain-containing protein [Bacillus sp. T33-2]|uniref:phosphatidylglycerol lysyltransferase domain-containing protein n=1 Tax=Bacillus sp. T33-2 TaxID=2054168 RepID=UPI000C784A57|nr:phosphatidylglycerol lysyltransferase domain-containing protein [Bacillus sp. T33-2]PLR91107.1 hypothetical protein CVD19_22115 [Bacillus sp. T33-2]
MFIILLFLLLSLLFTFHLSKRGNAENASDISESNRISTFLKNKGGNHTSHLSMLKDKQFFWAQNDSVLITFQQASGSYVVLGDPIGDDSLISGALNEFEHHCYRRGKRPVFYQVSPKYLNLYTKQRYRCIKIGEEAKVHLPDFSMAGKKRAKLRTRINRLERNGYRFSVLFPPHSSNLISEINQISDSWLGGRKEKGFSVSFFCENYVDNFPLAIVKNPAGTIIAFASLASNHQQTNRTITVDLMRYNNGSLHGTMDYLFVSIFQWCKQNEYEWCSLGMSPLANIKDSAGLFGPIGHFIFHRVNYLYNFKGLYEYKNKFEPVWESRYLMYRSFLPIVFLHIIQLIHQKQDNRDREGKQIKRAV